CCGSGRGGLLMLCASGCGDWFPRWSHANCLTCTPYDRTPNIQPVLAPRAHHEAAAAAARGHHAAALPRPALARGARPDEQPVLPIEPDRARLCLLAGRESEHRGGVEPLADQVRRPCADSE